MVLSMWVSLVGHNAGGRDCLPGTRRGLQGGVKRAQNTGICFAPAEGRTILFLGNKDFLTVRNSVIDTFSDLGSVKVLRIWTNDGR